MEVQQQTYLNSGKPQIREELRFVGIGKGSHCLQLDYQSVVHDEVRAISRRYTIPAVDDRQGGLAFEFQVEVAELDAKTGMVCTFEQSAAEMRSYFDGRADDWVRQIIRNHVLN